jgi:radical SAM/CxCxxxxC motif protein YfkAB
MLNKQISYNSASFSAHYDPWDPIRSLHSFGKHVLTSVEFTMSNLCNMRCEHCAVGDTLTMSEGGKLPLKLALERLDEVEHLETISITGGEPCYSEKTVKEYIIPILQYAQKRGIKSQINSNATLDYSRYEAIAPYLDVLHISFNYENVDDYLEIGFARSNHKMNRATAAKLYERMIDNAYRLSKGGLFVSAESMINYRTHHKLPKIHQLIDEMGCLRHEVHPMYPSSFASNLPMLSLDQVRAAIHSLLDTRNPEMWMLFGTLPFYHCNDVEADQKLLKRLQKEQNVSVRNDPDGRNRLNVNLFTGDVYVTDFAELSSLGNVHQSSLDSVFEKWTEHPLNLKTNCHCPAVKCCGPNLLVADAYYRDVDFKKRRAIL